MACDTETRDEVFRLLDAGRAALDVQRALGIPEPLFRYWLRIYTLARTEGQP